MKKRLLTLMLAFCPLLFMSSAMAAGITVYVQANTAPYLFTWGDASNGNWPGTKMTQSTTVNGTTFWYKEFSSANSLNIIFNNGSGSQTSDIKGLSSATGKYYYTYNGTTSYTDVTSQYGTVQDATIDNVSIAGSFNGWNTSNDLFTAVTANQTYTYLLDLTSDDSNVEFKILPNGNWLGINNLTIDAPSEWVSGNDNIVLANSTTGYATYTLTATWGGGSNAAAGWSLKIEGKDLRSGTVEHDYTVVGSSEALFGTAWDVTNTDNDLTKDETTGVYTWTKENVTLEAGTIYYKVAQDHAWNVSYGYSSGQDGNADYVVNENGIYNVTFFFDPSKTDEAERLYAEFTKVEDIVVDHEYTVVGDNEALFGTAWDVTNTANDLTKDETTGVYSWTKENVTLEANTTVLYKVVQDHGWDISYGYSSSPEGNADYVVSEGGIYTVAFYFDPSKTDEVERLYAEFTKTADLPVETQDFTVSFNDPGWEDVYAYAWTGETPIAAWPGTKLEKTGDVYTYTVNAAAAPANIIFNNGDGNGKQTPDLAFEADKTYTHVWTIAGQTNEITGDDDLIFGKPWDVTIEANDLTEGEDGKWTLTKEVELTEETSILFKAVYGHAWDISYGKADGSNQDYNNVAPGKYNVTFTYDPSAEGDKVTATFEEIVVQQTITATFVNTGDWEKVYAWAWTTEGEGDEAQTTNFFEPWPGLELTEKAAEQKDGHDVYIFTYTGNTLPANILFNNGEGTQTGDFELVDGQEYSYDVQQTITATFVNTGDWEKVYAWAWTTEGEGDEAQTTNFFEPWPGMELTEKAAEQKDGHDVYIFTYTGNTLPANILFNNGEGTQTGDFELVDGTEYRYDVPVVEKNFKAYFVNMAGWETVKAYAWNANGELTTWPGDDAVAATAVAPYGTETPTFEAAFAEAPTNVIFHNNDGTQTGDMTFLQEAYYTYDGLTSTSKLLFLDIDKEYTIANETAVEDMNVCYPRQFTPGQKSTVCLPFALTEEQAAAAGKFYRLISVTGTEVKYEEVTSTEANTPYLFIAAEGVEYPFENLYVQTLPATVLNEVAAGEAKMIATLETVDLTTDEETTYFGYNSENGKWTKATVGTLKPFRACLAIPSSSAAAKAFELDDNFNATGIRAIEGEIEKGAAVYDMQGRRVQTPTHGIYIMNGKKYVVK